MKNLTLDHFRRSLATALAGLCLVGGPGSGVGCLCNLDTDASEGAEDGSDGADDGWDDGADESSSADEDGPNQDDGPEGGSDGCYASTQVGCSVIDWATIETAIEALYLFDDTYGGYTKAEALELARALYDHGRYPEAFLEIVAVYPLDGSRWRAHVVVTDPSGTPLGELPAEAFAVRPDDAAALEAIDVGTLTSVDPGSLDLNFSIVIDDSGSIADCDANFVAQGLDLLLDHLPPVYSASLVKFTGEVDLVQERTQDPDALREALANACTDRGSTALWDAVQVGLEDLRGQAGFNALVVFSDGFDNASTASRSAIIDLAQEQRTPVFVLGLGLIDFVSLIEVALQSRGGFFYVNSGERVVEGFDMLAEFVEESYVIDFEVPEGTAEVEISASIDGQLLTSQRSL